MFTRKSHLWRPSSSWSPLHTNYTVKRPRRPFCKIWLLCWMSWWVMGSHSSGWICWLLSRKSMWLTPRIHPRMNKQDSTCMYIYLTQYVPNMIFLAWVGHGHPKRPLPTFIASFFLNASTKELWWGCLTIHPIVQFYLLARSMFHVLGSDGGDT